MKGKNEKRIFEYENEEKTFHSKGMWIINEAN
jgi:hypothetical protein